MAPKIVYRYKQTNKLTKKIQETKRIECIQTGMHGKLSIVYETVI